jgi:2-polyprenyl-3-methyl-5-hydroxy-6-metoxy-1,4-benzoquinol methylase
VYLAKQGIRFYLLERKDAMCKKLEYEKYNRFLKEKFYDLDKKEYDLFFRYFKRNYSKHLPEDKEVEILDAGCGLGHFVIFLKRSGYVNICGIDLDNDNVEHCRSLGLDNIRCGDMSGFLRKNVGHFDVIVMNDVIEHIPKEDVIRTLMLCKDALKEDGKLLLKTANCNNIYGLSGFFSDFTHKVGFTREKIMQVGMIAGFQGVEVFNLYLVSNFVVLGLLLRVYTFVLYKVKAIMFFINGRKNNNVHSKNLLAVLKKIEASLEVQK